MDDLSKLIKKAQDGDNDAFAKIYNLFYARIFRYCKYNYAEEAQDLCQETFLKAYKSIASFSEKKGGSFQAYLFRIARNLIIDFSRKKKALSIKEYQDFPDETNLDEYFDKKHEEKKINEVLIKLKDKERQVVMLRYFEDLSTAETAKVMGMREGALRVMAHRVLQKLKQMLEENE